MRTAVVTAEDETRSRDISTLYIFHSGNFKLVAKRFAASRTAVSARCAYRAVVWGWVWPSSLPTTCRDSPLETRCEANVWRRSWIRTAGFQIVKNLLRLPGICTDVASLAALQTCVHGRRMVTRAPFCPGKRGREVRVIGMRCNSCSAASLNGVCSVSFCLVVVARLGPDSASEIEPVPVCAQHFSLAGTGEDQQPDSVSRGLIGIGVQHAKKLLKMLARQPGRPSRLRHALHEAF